MGAKPGTVFTDRVKVRRGLRDVVIPQFVIYDPDAVVSQSVAIRVLEALGGIGPSTPGDYVRIKQEGTKIIVLADYAAKDFLYISPSSEEPIVLSEPILHLPPWQEELDRLQRLAG